MLESFLLVFISIFLAQMGDKTQLITLILATKTKKHFLLFLAIMTGFLVGVSLAVFVGAGISQLIPHKVLKIISAVILIIYFAKIITRKLQSHLIEKIAGALFVIIGILLFV